MFISGLDQQGSQHAGGNSVFVEKKINSVLYIYIHTHIYIYKECVFWN